MSERKSNLRIGIIMGSDSDLGTMRHAGRALTKLGLKSTVDYEERVTSVHRTPELAREYAATAESRGIRAIVAGAGGSAHLPGIVASETIVPVLGVAITKNPDVMNRALGSMIGMPEGKPLATFQGEAGAFNAGLFATRFLFAENPQLLEAYRLYQSALSSDVRAKDSTLKELGAEEYLRLNNPKTS
jgi:5-(carboxyamino)imidazole ribonucleotide mutase